MDKIKLGLLIIILTSSSLRAQKHTSPVLFASIAHMDSVTFNAFNAHNADLLKTVFSESVRFYNDGGGMSGYAQTMTSFQSMFERTKDIRRELVPGSLQVYPVKDYGAIEEGDHRFIHTENGETITGIFHFITVWKLEQGNWKMTEVVSVGHHTSENAHKEALYPEIAHADSLLFKAFNTQKTAVLQDMFDPGLLLYQDNTGLRYYAETIDAFKALFKKDYTLTRTLAPGTMMVYPLGNDGAIETGSHTFCHTENGKEDCATFKFVNIWKKEAGQWKINCLLTYDH